MLKKPFAIMVLAMGLALPARAAEVPLREEAHINNSLVAAAVGDAIRMNCPDIYARMITVYFKAKALENYARGQGYTEDEVRAFLDSREEKRRVLGIAHEYMKAHGVVEGDAESYCRLGRAEIAAESLIGSLLGER